MVTIRRGLSGAFDCFSGSLGSNPRGVQCKSGSGVDFFEILKPLLKTGVDAVTGGKGGKLIGPLVDKVSQKTKRMDAETFKAWINAASNEEVYAWAIGYTRDAHRRQQGTNYYRKLWAKLGVTEGGWQSRPGEMALRGLLGFMEGDSACVGCVPRCLAMHGIKAIVLTDYRPGAGQTCIGSKIPNGEARFSWVTGKVMPCLAARRVAQTAPQIQLPAPQRQPSPVPQQQPSWYSRPLPLFGSIVGIGALGVGALALLRR